jgi:hypothetical protein
VVIAAWFDPGLLTGVCAYDFEADELILLDEFDYINTGLVLDADERGWLLEKHVVAQYGEPFPDIRVGWENYRIMKGPQSQAPWSLETIGELRYLSAKYGYTVLDTAEPSARNVITGRMLKDIGWYPKVKAKKDAYSAAQHCLAWMLRENILPDKYKEPLYGSLR